MKKILVIVSCVLIISCQKEIVDFEANDVKQEESFEVKDGILFFNSESDMTQYLNKIINLDYNELEEFESSIGFKSLGSYYEKAMNENEKYLAYCENLPKDELEKMVNSDDFSVNSLYTESLIDKGILKEKTYDDGTQSIELVNYSHLNSLILNEDQIVAISGVIHKFEENRMIKILDGDLSKLENFESPEVDYYTITTDPNTKIFNSLKKNEYDGEDLMVNILLDDGSGENCSTWGCVRVIASVYGKRYSYWDNSAMDTEHEMYMMGTVETYKKVAGVWWHTSFYCDITGSFDYNVTTMSNNSTTYTTSPLVSTWTEGHYNTVLRKFYYNSYIKDFKVKLYPGITVTHYDTPNSNTTLQNNTWKYLLDK